jgi:hypothetical protein
MDIGGQTLKQSRRNTLVVSSDSTLSVKRACGDCEGCAVTVLIVHNSS